MSAQPKPVKAKVARPPKGGRGRRKDDPAAAEFPGVTVAGHPRAGASGRRAKGLGGIVGFGLAAGLSAKAGVPPELIGERAIGGGVAGFLIAWGCSVTVWRQLVMAEMRHASDLARERHAAAIEARRAASINPGA